MEARKVFVMWILVWSVIGGYWRCHHWSPAPSGWQESAGPGMRSLFVRSWLLLGGEWIHYQDPWPGLAAARLYVLLAGAASSLLSSSFHFRMSKSEHVSVSHQMNQINRIADSFNSQETTRKGNYEEFTIYMNLIYRNHVSETHLKIELIVK